VIHKKILLYGFKIIISANTSDIIPDREIFEKVDLQSRVQKILADKGY